jgi:hypothetical protein
MECAHQHVHWGHSAQRLRTMRGGAHHVRICAGHTGQERHDREGRRGCKAEPTGRAERRRIAAAPGFISGGDHRATWS